MSDHPARRQEEQQVYEIVMQTAEFLRDRKARDILVLDLQDLTGMTDYFVICTVNSRVHGRAIVRDLDEFTRERGMRPFSRDTGFSSPWVLLDYNYFIVHLFLEEARNHYQLEKLWSDADVVYERTSGEEPVRGGSAGLRHGAPVNRDSPGTRGDAL